MAQKFANNASVFCLDLAVSFIASIFSMLLLRAMMGAVLSFDRMLLLWMGVTLIASGVGILISGSYRIVIRHSTIKSINKHLLATFIKEAVVCACIALGFFLHFGGYPPKALYFCLLLDAMISLILLILLRVAIINGYARSAYSYADEVSKVSVMVYGTTNKSIAMVTRLQSSSNYNVIGFISPVKSENGQIIHDVQVWSYDKPEEVADLRNRLGFECVLFADHDEDMQAGIDALSIACIHNGIHVLNTPKISEARFGGISQEAIREFSSNEMIVDGMGSIQRNTKRMIDMWLAFFLLIVFSPLFLVCYLAIKLSDKGPAIYKQERIGRFGKPFYIYKFRSMRTDAEAAGPALYSGDDDPRLTKVGKFLRQHHLDELPQLWNVFKGDMAFIGWRPERKFYIDQIMEQDPRYYYLYQIRPGVTSYSTLKNGYTDTMEKMLRRLEFDLYYLRHRSLWFDVKILFQTFVSIVFGKKF